jgi:hypothetical protein
MKKSIIIITLAISFTTSAFASTISRLDLNKLLNQSEYVVLGKVINISNIDVRDKVTIRVASSLKGELRRKEVSFMLTTRGGIKDFDPQLRVGDMGVFFLNKKNGEIEKAYWGSIAIFSKNNFELNE